MSITFASDYGEIIKTSNRLSIKVKVPELNKEKFSTLINELSSSYASMNQKFILIIDLYEYKSLPYDPSYYRVIIDLFKKYLPITTEHLCFTILIIPNYTLQTSISIFFRFYKPLRPVFTFKNREKLESINCPN
jgi:hypothetical protein